MIPNIIIIIDVFRAFSTAAYILERKPCRYLITNKSNTVSRLTEKFPNSLLVGKPEKGSCLNYDIPNSPTRAKEADITNRCILHRTEAGATGILQALEQKKFDLVFAAGFVNADATAEYIKTLKNPRVTIIPMGHEAVIPSLEDNLCAEYIDALINGKNLKISSFFSAIKKGPGKCFLSDDQWQYPREDFECCLEIKRFNFIIKAKAMENYAFLERHDVNLAMSKSEE